MRNKQIRYLHVAALTLVLTLLPLLAMGGGTVPKATCGPDDRTESGLQGQTTLDEQQSGDSELGYNCNLELVGQTQGEGTSWQMAWFDDCAYYVTANNPAQMNLGTVVVDASDPRNPQATEFLTTDAMLNPWESLKVNKKRKLLAGVQLGGPGFDIYDVSDCRHPVLEASVVLPGERGHGGEFAPDGLTYWGVGRESGSIRPIYAIDVSDPSNPRRIFRIPDGIGVAHDLSVSQDGTRLYVAQPGNLPGRPANGLVILDVSDIQFRRPNPQVSVISTLFWEDGSIAQYPQPVTIRGRPYLIFTDEAGSSGIGRPAVEDACARDLPPFGFARIIDISDENNPTVVSKLMLEVHDPDNCDAILADPEDVFFGYDGHYCGVDNARNAKILACSYFRAGIRVFDIRDPSHPKEIAYFKPGARRTEVLPGSQLARFTDIFGNGDRTTDWATARIRIRKHKKAKGEKAKGKKAKGKKDKSKLEIWFTTQDNGFQIVRFTNGADKLGKKKKGKKGKK